MAASVDVSVEALQECSIQEISLDGQETYKLPMSMSEEFTMLVNLLDFTQEEGDAKVENSEGEGALEEGDDEVRYTEVSSVTWPWQSVRNKLRLALVELSVLQDVLTIGRDRRYMSLDCVPIERIENKSPLVMIARKRALAAGGAFMSSGLERMKRNLDNTMYNKICDFHYELLKLRTTWRLKKVGGAILGDMSYKSAGSLYWKSGTFEITKTDTEQNNPTIKSTTTPVYNIQQKQQVSSNLSVTIPNELLGACRIKVAIKQLCDDTFKLDGITTLTKWYRAYLQSSSSSSSSSSSPQENLTWSKRLELSQNILFCEELFSQLYQEAIDGEESLAHTASGNHCLFQVFDNIKLFVSLCRTPDSQSLKKIMQQDIYTDPVTTQQQLLQQQLYNNKKKKPTNPYNNNMQQTSISNTVYNNTITTNTVSNNNTTTASNNNSTTTDYCSYNEVLEHSLYQLLRGCHQRSATLPMPHPTSTPLSLTPWRHLSGPQSFSKTTIQHLNHVGKQRKMILSSFLSQVIHTVLRIKVLNILDRVVTETTEPQIILHPNFLNSSTHSSIRMHIFFTGYEMIRTNLTFFIRDSDQEMKVALKDGSSCILRVQEAEIRALVFKQLLQHHLQSVQLICKMFNWRLSSLNNNLLLTNTPNHQDLDQDSSKKCLQEAAVMTITSPYHDKEVSVTCFSSNKQLVYLKRTSSSKPSSSSSLPSSLPSSKPSTSSAPTSSSSQPLASSFSDRTDRVHMGKMPGKNFAQKFETLLAALNPDLTMQ